MKSKKVISTIFVVLSLTLFSKAFGLVRNALIASNFGTSADADAYQTAVRITAQLFMTLGSAVTATAIPIIIGYISKKNNDKSNFFVSNAMTSLVILTSIITLVGIGLSPLLVKLFAFGFDAYRLELTTKLVQIMFPILVIIPVVYLFVSVLQSHGKFSVTSMLSIPFNFVVIGYLIFLTPKYGIQGLAVATLIGWMAQGLVQIPFAAKKGFKYKPTFDINDKDLRLMLRLIVPILLSSAVYNVNMLIDNAIASTLTVGRLSSLSYAFVVYTAVSSTIIYGVSTVLFPNFAEFVEKNNLEGLKSALTSIIKGMLFIVMPMILGLLALRVEIIQIIYMRDEFTLADSLLTAGPLGYYMIGMIGFAFQDIFNRAFFALRNTKLPLMTSIISVTTNIVLNLILVQFFDLNGLAMATSIAVILNGLMLFAALNNQIGRFDIKSLVLSFTKVTFAAILMYVSVKYFVSLKVLDSLIISTGLSVLIGIVIYAVTTIILKVESAEFILTTTGKIIKKIGGKHGN